MGKHRYHRLWLLWRSSGLTESHRNRTVGILDLCAVLHCTPLGPQLVILAGYGLALLLRVLSAMFGDSDLSLASRGLDLSQLLRRLVMVLVSLLESFSVLGLLFVRLVIR